MKRPGAAMGGGQEKNRVHVQEKNELVGLVKSRAPENMNAQR